MRKNNFFMATKEQIQRDKEISNKNGRTIKCKIDTNIRMNIIYQESFSFDDDEKVINTLKECFYEFHTNNNDYPIVIIENMNGGGSTLICEFNCFGQFK